MFAAAQALLSDSLQSYDTGDLELAHGVQARDKQLDLLNAELTEQATQEITQNPTQVSDHLAIILIARHLERIGDHAKNIAENAIYAVSDEDIRHSRSRPS